MLWDLNEYDTERYSMRQIIFRHLRALSRPVGALSESLGLCPPSTAFAASAKPLTMIRCMFLSCFCVFLCLGAATCPTSRLAMSSTLCASPPSATGCAPPRRRPSRSGTLKSHIALQGWVWEHLQCCVLAVRPLMLFLCSPVSPLSASSGTSSLASASTSSSPSSPRPERRPSPSSAFRSPGPPMEPPCSVRNTHARGVPRSARNTVATCEVHHQRQSDSFAHTPHLRCIVLFVCAAGYTDNIVRVYTVQAA
jgi:hypothetical protein